MSKEFRRYDGRVSIHFTHGMREEILQAAQLHDRSMSWIVQAAWKIARQRLMSAPTTVPQIGGEDAGQD